jgi:hypothetical protein
MNRIACLQVKYGIRYRDGCHIVTDFRVSKLEGDDGIHSHEIRMHGIIHQTSICMWILYQSFKCDLKAEACCN